MITSEDIKKMIAAFAPIFATKQDLKELEERMASKIELSDLKSDVMTKMDQVYGEVIAMRQEQVAHTQRHEDIDKSLKEIRSIPVIAHSLKK